MGLDMYLRRSDRTAHSVQELVKLYENGQGSQDSYAGEHTMGEILEMIAQSENESPFKTVGEWRNA